MPIIVPFFAQGMAACGEYREILIAFFVSVMVAGAGMETQIQPRSFELDAEACAIQHCGLPRQGCGCQWGAAEWHL